MKCNYAYFQFPVSEDPASDKYVVRFRQVGSTGTHFRAYVYFFNGRNGKEKHIFDCPSYCMTMDCALAIVRTAIVRMADFS